jgi:hypothetical protein
VAVPSALQFRISNLDLTYIGRLPRYTLSALKDFLDHTTSNMTSPQDTQRTNETAMYAFKRAQEWVLLLTKLRKAKIEVDSYCTFLRDWETNGSRSQNSGDELMDEGWGYDT